MKNIFLLSILLLIAAPSFSQEIGVCGMTAEDQEILVHDRTSVVANRSAINYIPVQFHMVANGDGSNRGQIYPIFDMLDKINKDYAHMGFVFYLKNVKDWGFFNHGNANNSPGSNSSVLIARKKPGAINVFITLTAETGNSSGTGTTLAFYQPGGDFVVVRQNQVNGTNFIFSHEIGHFFSLRHTFYGWENQPYDEQTHGNPIKSLKVPGTNFDIELANKSNCNTAADQLCDTPPDYNFGFSANNCNYSKVVLDSNLDTVKPMVKNFMGYFITCTESASTPHQDERMMDNYFGTNRNYLRSSYIPNTNPVVESAIQVFPAVNQLIPSYNYVDLDWEDQPSADQYLVEIFNGSEYYYDVVKESYYVAQDLLKPKTTYFWRVRGFNDGNTSKIGASRPFRTGDVLSSVQDQDPVLSPIKINPNPVYGSQNVQLSFFANNQGDAQISVIDLSGRILSRDMVDIQYGENDIPLNTNNLSPGLYIVQVAGRGIHQVVKMMIAE